jgi:hypothetical protein
LRETAAGNEILVNDGPLLFVRDSLWEHRRGGVYRVLLIARREADRTLDIVYRDEASGQVYTRPARDFFDGRFTPISGLRPPP